MSRIKEVIKNVGRVGLMGATLLGMNAAAAGPNSGGETQVSKSGHTDVGSTSPLKDALSGMFGVQTAFADRVDPIHVERQDGRLELIASLEKGEGVIFYAPQGMEIKTCGVRRVGPTIAAIVATESNMGATAIGNPELYADPITIPGDTYPELVIAQRDLLNKKVVDYIQTKNSPVQKLNIALVRTDNGETVCKADEDNGQIFPIEPAVPNVPVVPAVPVPTAVAVPIAACVRLEVPLGTTSGNRATVNEVTVTREVIAHGDLYINSEFRADDSGATGLIQRVHASPSNPARIGVVQTNWGGDVAAFCTQADMDANVAQGVANLQSQGMKADVIDWPGPKQQ